MVRDYIIIAAGSVAVGVVLTVVVIRVSLRLGINVFGENIWVLAIPAVSAVILNITLLELYRRFRKRK